MRERSRLRSRTGARGARGPRGARRWMALSAAAALLAVPLWPASAASPANVPPWQGSWSTSVQPPGPGFFPNWSEKGFDRQTVRQVIRVSEGGTSARFALSNRYGASALKIAGATVARTGEGASVRKGTVRPLTFKKRGSVTIPAGGKTFSDAVRMRVSPLESLTVTLYLAEPTGPATYHMTSVATSYRASGDHRSDESGTAFTETSESWYYLAGAEVRGERGAGGRDGVVAFGDSITDGYGATVDADNRYPDELAERYVREGRPRGVLNHGISGNMITTGTSGTGESGVDRFRKDVLAEPGVGTVIVLEGINDIGLGRPGGDIPDVSVAQLIAAHRDLAAQARAAGLKVIGATLLPFKDAQYFTARGEAKRDALNDWIRTSGTYDEVVDLDRTMAAPDDKDLLAPTYDSGDHLHPNDTGYHAMAEQFDTAVSAAD
ncbi:SGNH/GDSL hydrolase family protein [Streptomyces sp. NPDC048172]|uniref:SGNH/GDSL hydrolase family protein n=1 Tax=Streptomyces sp. NPDC048172 TaxID=3365505 RepID=UPI003719A570